MHVVIGQGAVGSTTAELLVAEGAEVRLVSRTPRTPIPGVEHVTADAADADALTRAVDGATVLYNCVNPAYHRWATDWPPMAEAMLTAAERTGAVLVITGNLYPYGRVDGPMTEDLPLTGTGTKARVRAGLWRDALARHDAGRIRVTEARAADFYGPRVLGEGHLGERVIPRLLAGRPVNVVGDPDAPHSWSYLPDVARALVTLGRDERAWGRPWHVPSQAGVSSRAMVDALADAADTPPVRVSGLPRWAIGLAGLADRRTREVLEVHHQFTRPFVLDSSAYTATFGGTATPTGEAAAATVAWWRRRMAGPSAR